MRAYSDAAAILLLALASFTLADHAEAAQLACKRHSISTADQRHLHEVAAKALPALEIDWSSASYCDLPPHALAWFGTKPVEQPDLTQLMTHADCSRKRGSWTCKTTLLRTMVVAEVGPPNPIAYIPTDMDVTAAHAVLTQAFAIVSGPPPAEPQHARAARFDMVRSDFLSKEGNLDLEYVEDKPQTVRVSRNSSYMDFGLIREASGDRYEYCCWGEVIIVD
jgi:hypothetical protein